MPSPKIKLKLGITATRNGLSTLQKQWFIGYLQREKPIEVHHGACIGGDEWVHMVAMLAIKEGVKCRVVIHPPEDESRMMDLEPWRNDPNVTILPAKPYWDRNHDIVDSCNRLAAMPDGPETPHGGTWGTVRYARGRKPYVVCLPTGKLAHMTSY